MKAVMGKWKRGELDVPSRDRVTQLAFLPRAEPHHRRLPVAATREGAGFAGTAPKFHRISRRDPVRLRVSCTEWQAHPPPHRHWARESDLRKL